MLNFTLDTTDSLKNTVNVSIIILFTINLIISQNLPTGFWGFGVLGFWGFGGWGSPNTAV